jgi:hypothetical protein
LPRRIVMGSVCVAMVALASFPDATLSVPGSRDLIRMRLMPN